jgi:hypothetical protein
MKRLAERELPGKTEVLGQNLSQCRFVQPKLHVTTNATNRLSYATACRWMVI